VEACDALVVDALVLEPGAEGIFGCAPGQVADPNTILAALSRGWRLCGCGLLLCVAIFRFGRFDFLLFLLFALCFFGGGLRQVDVDLELVFRGDDCSLALFLLAQLGAGTGGALALAVGHVVCGL
jgi:hypothetical protein